jgi:hypothetical protein
MDESGTTHNTLRPLAGLATARPAPQPVVQLAAPSAAPLAAPPAGPVGALRCQWCSVALPAGSMTCPRCGSHGVPDPNLDPAEAMPDLFEPAPIAAKPAEELVEWWRDGDAEAEQAEEAPRKALPSSDDVERRQFLTIATMIAAAVLCTLLGWLLGPQLTGAMESVTGTPVEDPSSLRGLGAFVGLLVGLFAGATGGWIIGSGR